jgi:hypothetical protein
LNNELAMSVRGRSGEEEAQEGETDRRAPGFQPHIHLFVCGRNCIVASFFRLFVFLHDCPCLLVSCRKSQRDLLLYDRSNGVAVLVADRFCLEGRMAGRKRGILLHWIGAVAVSRDLGQCKCA